MTAARKLAQTVVGVALDKDIASCAAATLDLDSVYAVHAAGCDVRLAEDACNILQQVDRQQQPDIRC